MITFACPHCQKLIELQQDVLGSTVPCPHCAQQVKVNLDMLFSEHQPAPAAAPSYSAVAPQSGNAPFDPKQPAAPGAGGTSTWASLMQAVCALGMMAAFYLIAFILCNPPHFSPS